MNCFARTFARDKTCDSHLEFEIAVLGNYPKDKTKMVMVGRAYVCRKHRQLIERWGWPTHQIRSPIRNAELPIKNIEGDVPFKVGQTDQTSPVIA